MLYELATWNCWSQHLFTPTLADHISLFLSLSSVSVCSLSLFHTLSLLFPFLSPLPLPPPLPPSLPLPPLSLPPSLPLPLPLPPSGVLEVEEGERHQVVLVTERSLHMIDSLSGFEEFKTTLAYFRAVVKSVLYM